MSTENANINSDPSHSMRAAGRVERLVHVEPGIVQIEVAGVDARLILRRRFRQLRHGVGDAPDDADAALIEQCARTFDDFEVLCVDYRAVVAAADRLTLARSIGMSPELMMWFVLTTKMAVTALFVTAATIVAERLGATVGALVAKLPVSAGPVYVFLALDHDSTFISSSAVASLALNSATAIYLTAYVLIAQRRSMWLSISFAFAMWLAAVLVLSPVQWTTWSASALNVVVFTACTFIVQPFSLARIPRTT